MRRQHIYLDTSVLGGCFDPEFAPWSRALVADFRAGRFVPLLSDLLGAELERGPTPVRELHAELLTLVPTPQPLTGEVDALATRHAAHGIVGPKFRNDLLHIALATVADADIAVSWNVRHIVRFDKLRAFNAVNLEAGYKPIAIHSPREVATYGPDAERLPRRHVGARGARRDV